MLLCLLSLLALLPFAGQAARRLPGRAGASAAPPKPHGILVGYFPQWGVYDRYFVKNLEQSGGAAQLDQINYAQGFVTGGHCSVADPNADLNFTFSSGDSVTGVADDPATPFRGNFHQLVALKRRYPKLKVLISLEGRGSDFAADAQPTTREAFVRSCVDLFIRGKLSAANAAIPDQPALFDGIDVDWEYPHGPDAENFLALLRELRQQMDAVRPGLRLTIAVGPSPRMYPGVNMAEVAGIVDQIGLMNYDYAGPWNKTTGFLAPLFAGEGQQGGSVERTIAAYKEAGAPPAKMLMGVPFYGYGWKAVASTGNGLFQPGTSIRGDKPYSYIRALMDPVVPAAGHPPAQVEAAAESGKSVKAPSATPSRAAAPFVLYRDPRSRAPWLYDGDTFWTYEDPTSVRFKVDFAVEQQLGGVMAWELSEDAPDAALLKAARSRLEHHGPRM